MFLSLMMDWLGQSTAMDAASVADIPECSQAIDSCSSDELVEITRIDPISRRIYGKRTDAGRRHGSCESRELSIARSLAQ